MIVFAAFESGLRIGGMLAEIILSKMQHEIADL